MIRKATIKDVSRIAEIEISSCRYAYKNIITEEILFRDTVVLDRINVIQNWISIDDFNIYVFEDDENQIIKGIMGTGKCGEQDKPNAFELHLLYIEPNYSRNGIGGKLIKYFENEGRQNRYKEFVIWVLKDNEIGINFYIKNKYITDNSKKIFQRYNKEEIRYLKNLKTS
jgi:ribosomal protein S18 acetylase RimI-like enzyme